MTHATLRKFGYPQTLIHESEHWAVLLRPQQVTLGSLVLAARAPVMAFGDLPAPAFAAMQDAVRHIEQTLAKAFRYQRINYLMLMMVDPHVHFHVLPRYDEPRQFAGASFTDAGWPGPPRLDQVNATDADLFNVLLESIKSTWHSF